MKQKPKGVPVLLGALGAVGAGAAAYVFAFRPWHMRWGATNDEVRQPLPGDDLTINARTVITRGITVHAPPAAIWPWIVQIGQDRAGFYSYDFLENAMGLDIHSAEQIIPDLQVIEPGDRVYLAPEAVWLDVALVEPEVAFVLSGRFDAESGQPVPPEAPNSSNYSAFSWCFYLESIDFGATRLVVRSRYYYPPGLMDVLSMFTIEPAHFIMEQKMMKGIRDRAENHYQLNRYRYSPLDLPEEE